MEATSQVLRARELEPRGKRVDAGEVLRGHVSDQQIRHKRRISSDITGDGAGAPRWSTPIVRARRGLPEHGARERWQEAVGLAAGRAEAARIRGGGTRPTGDEEVAARLGSGRRRGPDATSESGCRSRFVPVAFYRPPTELPLGHRSAVSPNRPSHRNLWSSPPNLRCPPPNLEHEQEKLPYGIGRDEYRGSGGAARGARE